MNKKQWFYLLLLYTIPFLGYFFLRESIVGYDSYYYLWLEGIPNELFWLVKMVLFCLGLVYLLGIMALAKHFKANAYYVGLIAIALSPLIFMDFSMFENDQFAFAALPWVVLMCLQKPLHWKLTGLIVLVGAGLIWQGSIYYLFALALTNLYFIFPAVMAFGLFLPSRIIGNILPNALVSESQFGLGLVFVGLLLPGLWKIKKDYVLGALTLFFLAIGVLNSKFVFHVLPFLAILMFFVCQELYYKYFKWQGLLKQLSFQLPIYMAIIWLSVLLAYPPSPMDTKIVKEFVAYASQKAHLNDWTYGHWIRYYGLEPSAHSGGIWQQDYNHGIIMTRQDLNCQLVLDYNLEMRVYEG